MMPSWGIVTTALEPTPLLLSFVAYHLEAGAAEIHIYLECPDAEFEAAVAEKPNVHIIRAGKRAWGGLHHKPRPERVWRRQILNANHAGRTAKCDWLLHCDIDEYVIRPKLIVDHLARLGPEVISVPLMNAERVFRRGQDHDSVFDGVFRKRFNSENDLRERLVYGRAADLLTNGFAGYASGKCFTRTGRNARIDIHRTILPEDQDPDRLRKGFQRVGLIHFDAMTQKGWQDKLSSKIADGISDNGYTSGRQRQFDRLRKSAGGSIDVKWLFERVCCLGWVQYLALSLNRKILRVRFDVTPALRAQFPNLEVDLSPEGIDRAYAALNRRKAALAAV